MYRSAMFRDIAARLSRLLGSDEAELGQQRTRSWDLVIVITATLLALVAIATGFQPIRWVFAAPLVLLLPGYALVAATSGRRAMGVCERLLLSLGVSVAVVVVGGVLFNLAGWGLRTTTWAIALGCLTLIASIVALARRDAYELMGVGPNTLTGASGRWSIRMGVRQAALLAVAVVVLSGAVVAARAGATEQPTPGYTQLWLLPSSASAHRATAQLGIKNMEAKSVTYKLAYMVNGKAERTWPAIRIQPGAAWQITVALPSAGSSTAPVEAVLYRVDAPHTVYRHVELQPGS